MRNLAGNPAVTVHRCDADDVVIVEGVAYRLDADTASPSRLDRVDAAYEVKYGVPYGTPVFAIRPRAVYAWTDFPAAVRRACRDPGALMPPARFPPSIER